MNRRLVPGYQQHAAQACPESFRFINVGLPGNLVDAVLNIDLTTCLSGTGLNSDRRDQ